MKKTLYFLMALILCFSAKAQSTWTAQTSPTTSLLNDIAYSGSVYVAVGSGGVIIRSTNGTTWTTVTSGVSTALNSVTYGNGRFIAVGNSGSVLTSPDGITWTSQTSGTTQLLNSVRYLGNIFWAVGSSGTIIYSMDGGSTWTARTSGTTQPLRGICYNAGKYTVVGSNGTILTGIGGVSWNSETSGTTNILYNVIYANGKYVAVGAFGTVLYSTNGTSWSAGTSPITTVAFQGLTFGGGKYVATGASGNIITSSDGISWSSATSNSTGSFTGVLFTGTQFFTVGASGQIYTSQVSATCSQVATTTETMTWNGLVSTDWNNACNWTPNGIPTATNDVIIPIEISTTLPNYPVINSNVTIKSLSVSADLTINSGTTLNIVNNLDCNIGPPYDVTNNGVVNVGGNSALSGAESRLNSIYNGVRWTNNTCARFNTTGNFVLSGKITNTGYVYVGGDLNVEYIVSPFDSPVGFFSNNGVLKYNTISGVSYFGNLVENTTNSSVIVKNTPDPIFTYGGVFNGTVNGIFINATATTSAGTFTAPNTFTPSGLPAGSQTLYAKITPSGGACEYIVPFTYNNGCSQVATATETMTWNGSVSSDWANPCNWSPNGVPTATNEVAIDDVTNDPVIFSSTAANCKIIYINNDATLTINSGGSINVNNTNPSNGSGGTANAIIVYTNASIVNNGTLTVSSAGDAGIELQSTGATLTNSGTITMSNLVTRGIKLYGDNTMVTNNASGIINLQTNFIGIQYIPEFTGHNFNNQGVINYTGTSYTIELKSNDTFTNSGTFNITSGNGVINGGGTINNQSCGKILMLAGNYDNSASGSVTTNNGVISIAGTLNNSTRTFTNNGVLKYGTLTGTITNNNGSVRVNDNPTSTTIFTYQGTFTGTIDGIFTNATATTSAGTFTAPNTFTPSGTLPSGSQTLYAKITPSGGACDYIVPFTYNNSSPEINIKGNNLSIASGDIFPSIPDHTDFGSVNVSSGTVVRTFTIENTGTGALNLTGTSPNFVTISGTHASNFTVTSQPSSTVAATNGTTTFQVTFDPSASGLRTATVNIANDDADENPYTFDIQGMGTAPEMDVKGNNVSINDGDTSPSTTDHTDFGSVNAASGTVVRTFTIENTGTGALNLTGSPDKVFISGSFSADFAVTTQPTSPVAATNGTTTFQVTFNPSGTGARTVTVNIANDDSNENPYTFDIRGTGTAPEINVKGNGVSIVNGDTTPTATDHTNFGSTNTNSGTVVRTFTIENIGGEILNLTGNPKVAISGADPSDFTVTMQPTSPVAATTGTTTFDVTFAPSANGIRTATISIANDDSDENPYTFAIRGTGSGPEIDVRGAGQSIVNGNNTPNPSDDTSFGFAEVSNQTITKTFTIVNMGTASLTLTGTPKVEISGTHASDFSVITQPSSLIAGSNGSTTFQIRFDPSQTGLRTALVTIANDDLDENPYTFAISGDGLAETFITRWNLATTGSANVSGSAQLNFGAFTFGPVTYYWNEVGGGNASGSGTFTGPNANISGLPSNAIIDLQIYPTNLHRFFINNGADKSRLTEIKQWGTTAWTSMENAFYGCNNMVLNATDVPNLAAVNNMSYMFANCTSFNQTLPNGFNTSAVTNMSYMFLGCSAYNKPLPASFNTASVTNMIAMFKGCSVYDQPFLSSFNTAAVTHMEEMFRFCSAFNQVLPSSFNTSNVVSMGSMFQNCTSYNQALPSSFNTVRVLNMSSMFAGCSAYDQPLPSNFNTAAVTNMDGMFTNCSIYNKPLPNSFNTGAVTSMQGMFQNCSLYNQAFPSNFTTGAVLNMENMFNGASAFDQNIGNFNIANTTAMRDIFYNSGISINNYDNILIAWNNAGYTNKNLGEASPLQYCAAQSARNTLTTTKGWQISGDVNGCSILTLSSNNNPSVHLSSVIFTATLTNSSGGINGQVITFKNGATTLGTAVTNSSGVASITVSNLSVSTHSITAEYAGNSPYTAATSNTVSQVVNCETINIQITGSNNLSCSTTSVTRTASGGNSYSWSNGLGTNAQATITSAGTYTVTVTGSNGCTATATTTVTADLTIPNAQISGSDNLSCAVTSVTRTASGGGTYLWSNGLGTNAIANITSAGTYTVTVTGSNGCTATATTTVTANLTTPNAQITGSDNLSCAVTSVTRTASGGGTYLWSNGLGTNTIANITSAGTYTVTVTGSNGCTATATTTVTSDLTIPNAQISGSDNLTCAVTSVTRTATGGGTYLWSNGLGTNAIANITSAGTYTVTVTGSNGCTATATTTVTSDLTIPNVQITGSDILTCAVTSVTRTASGGGSYLWSNGIGTNAIATITSAGTYTITVTGSNGCTATATTTVTNDGSLPNVQITGSNNLSCATTNVTRTASGGGTYLWSNGLGTNAIANITSAGTYTVTVTGSNGCTATATTTVTNDGSLPNAQITGSDNLSCAVTSVTRTATGGGTYLWSNGLGTNAIANITSAGTYTVTVTGSNGCTATATTTVTADLTIPNAQISGSNNLSCAVTSVTRTASGGGTYLWSNGIGTNAIANITSAGTYTVTVTGSNGCTATATTTVTNDGSLPNVQITGSNNLSCAVTSVIRTASGGGSYLWSNGLGTNAIATITSAGTYTVTVTGSNGCTATATTTVTNDGSLPNVQITGSNNLSCATTNVTRTASGGGTYLWSNGLGTNAQATITSAGTYTVTVTGSNGCTATATTTVTNDESLPNAQISGSGNLTCAITSVTRTATGGGSYLWSNGLGTNAQATITSAGTYTVTVTGSNGCTATATTTVTNDGSLPNAQISGSDNLNCATTSVTRTASGSGTYSWSNGLGTNAIATITSAGTYTVTVTGSNGCTATATTTVTSDLTIPNVQITGSDILTCAVTSVIRTASGGGTYLWSNGLGTNAIATITSAGTYTVTVTGSNGCTATVTTSVTFTNNLVATASNSGPYRVGNTIELSASGGSNYTWSGPNNFVSTSQNPSISNALVVNAGVYTVTVSTGGCSATATTNVVIDALIDPCTPVIDYQFVKAGNPYQPLFNLTNGITINQIADPVSIVAVPICPTITIESLVMKLQGPNMNEEILQNVSPYAIFDNTANSINGRILAPGVYTLTVTGYNQDNMLGGINYGPVVTTFTILPNIASIATPTVSKTAICGGSNLDVSFSINGIFNPTNQFKVELSDANGNFGSVALLGNIGGSATFTYPTIIGTSNSAGTITCSIPSTLNGGTNYRIRVVSTDGVSVSQVNGSPITIHPRDLNLVSPTDDYSTNIGTKQASNKVTASNKISATANVNYQAGKAIILNVGFEANAGTVFKAEIGGCNN